MRIADIRAECAKGGVVQSALLVHQPDGAFVAYVRVSWKRGYYPIHDSRDRRPRTYHGVQFALAAVREHYRKVVWMFEHDDPDLARLKPFWPQEPAESG